MILLLLMLKEDTQFYRTKVLLLLLQNLSEPLQHHSLPVFLLLSSSAAFKALLQQWLPVVVTANRKLIDYEILRPIANNFLWELSKMDVRGLRIEIFMVQLPCKLRELKKINLERGRERSDDAVGGIILLSLGEKSRSSVATAPNELGEMPVISKTQQHPCAHDTLPPAQKRAH